MIRINLVGETRKAPAARVSGPSSFAIDSENAAAWCLVILLVVGSATYGIYWFILDRELSQRQDEIATAQKRVEELQDVLDEVDYYIARREELDHKIGVISELRDNQRGPVRIMDEVSTALPDLLWLDELDLNARQVTMKGRAFTTNSVAAFIENLTQVEEFREPVLKQARWNGRAYAFEVSFTYRVVPIHKPLSEGTVEESPDTAQAAAPAR